MTVQSLKAGMDWEAKWRDRDTAKNFDELWGSGDGEEDDEEPSMSEDENVLAGRDILGDVNYYPAATQADSEPTEPPTARKTNKAGLIVAGLAAAGLGAGIPLGYGFLKGGPQTTVVKPTTIEEGPRYEFGLVHDDKQFPDNP